MTLAASPTLLDDYQRDGVVRIRQFISPTDLLRIRSELAAYIKDIAPALPASEVTFEADGKTARNLWRMEKHSPFFAEVARRPEILKFVSTLVRGEPVLLGVETFNK